MKLITLSDGSRDGRLHVASRDLARAAPATGIADTLQQALERWSDTELALRALADRVDADRAVSVAVPTARVIAPLPRAWQWLDGSAFESHGALMAQVFGMDPAPRDRPLMYQGVSDRFYGPTDDIPLPSEDDGIDFEGEYGVIVDTVPMGVGPAEAERHIRLVVQINDWSLRKLAPIEMKTGFGWVQAKPPCSLAPAAITPDELGDGWRDARVALPLEVDWNGERFGRANGGEMAFSFAELVAHAARTRQLVAGTIIGSGTVSNADFRQVGSACIAERRGIEQLDEGQPRTGFMRFGDRVRMAARAADGTAPFGAIDQKVVRA
ncbi:MAG: fumarylacetoacetate hydrolase family protein [Sphingomonas fennica]